MESAATPVPLERRRGDRPLRVLIADDDRDTVEMLAVVLREEGHVVYTAFNGADVLPAIQAFRPDVIVLDVNLPKVSGYALAQATRYSFTDVRKPLIIAISGVWTQTPDRIVGRQVGFDHYLVKPADPAELLRLLEAFRRPQ